MNHNITDFGIPPESELRGIGINKEAIIEVEATAKDRSGAQHLDYGKSKLDSQNTTLQHNLQKLVFKAVREIPSPRGDPCLIRRPPTRQIKHPASGKAVVL